MNPRASANAGIRPAHERWPRATSLWRWALLAVLASTGSLGVAADLQVNPIMVEFAAGEQAQAVWLSNTGTAPIRAQVRVAAWSQADGEEQQLPTRELVASPAIVEIASGAEQLVRLIRTQATAPQSEMAFRLTIDELPPDASQPVDGGLLFLLRYSVPVFVLAEGTSPLGPSRRTASSPATADVADSLSFQLEAHGEQRLLRVTNRGRQRVRVSNVAWESTDGQRTTLVPGLLGYVLAGQQMHWPLPLPPALQGGGGTLKARLNDQPSDQTLPLDPAGS